MAAPELLLTIATVRVRLRCEGQPQAHLFCAVYLPVQPAARSRQKPR